MTSLTDKMEGLKGKLPKQGGYLPKSVGWGLAIDACKSLVKAEEKQIEKQVLNRVLKIIDGHKEVYQKGDERFDTTLKDGDEKDHIDSFQNEILDDVIKALTPHIK